MTLLVEYGDCPRCWQETQTARPVGFDPEKGIVCEAGHKFDAAPEFRAPKKLHTLEPEAPRESASSSPAESAPARASEGTAEASPAPSVGLDPSCQTGPLSPVAVSGSSFANRPAVGANEAVRLEGRDLLFGLVIPEGMADNLAAYAEEQKTTLAEIVNGVVVNILKQEWWK